MQSLLLSRAISCSRSTLLVRNARFLTTKPPPRPNSPPSSTSKTPEDASASTPPTESTADASNATATAESVPPSPASLSLDFSPVQEPHGQRAEGQTGAKSSKDSLSSIERKRRNLGRASLALLGLGIASGAVYLGRNWEEGELKSLKIVRDLPFTRNSSPIFLSAVGGCANNSNGEDQDPLRQHV